uniref:Uncharacterized protein n=1 Tax=Cannabis sativa TaxID=3483 RepID=A0A803PKX9_CANSA
MEKTFYSDTQGPWEDDLLGDGISMMSAFMEKVNAYIEKVNEYMAKNDDLIHSNATSLKNLEKKVEELSWELHNNSQGVFPSDMQNVWLDDEEITWKNNEDFEKCEETFEDQMEPTSIQNDEQKGEKIINSNLLNSISTQGVEKLFDQSIEETLIPPPLLIHQVIGYQYNEKMVMDKYTYEDSFLLPPNPPPLASFLGFHYAQSFKKSQVEHWSSQILHLAKLEGVQNNDPYVRAYATLYGRKPLFMSTSPKVKLVTLNQALLGRQPKFLNFIFNLITVVVIL